MKKLMILSIMISLFAFWGSKNEVNKVHAEEVVPQAGTSATFGQSLSSAIGSYYTNLASIKISNNRLDISSTNLKCIPLKDCTYTDASGVTTTPAEGVIFAYISKADGYTTETPRYNCVLYANVDTIYANPDARKMFFGLQYLKTLDIEMLNTSKVTNMYGMFYNCMSLTTLNLSEFDTSNVTDMSYMFYQCWSLTELVLSNKFNTASVTNMSYMFESCSSLKELNLSNFNTSNVTDMSDMFDACSSLTKLNVSSFNTSKVTNMENMFGWCSSLTEINLSNFDTRNVVSIYQMFDGCSSLSQLDLSNFDLSNARSIGGILSDCEHLRYIKSPSMIMENKRIELPTQFETYLGVSELNATNLSQYPELSLLPEAGTAATFGRYGIGNGLGAYRNKIVSIKLSNNILEIPSTLAGERIIIPNCTYIDASGIESTPIEGVIFAYLSEATNSTETNKLYNCVLYANVETIYANSDANSMFFGYQVLEKFDITILDTSKVINMFGMFQNCPSLTELDLSNFKTSNVIRMHDMFSGCSSLTSLDLSSFDTSKVITMERMFQDCSSLTNVDLSSFKTTNVGGMTQMFEGCKSLSEINLSNFVTSNVEQMDYMFSGCSSLTELNLSNFDTSKVSNMNQMFRKCSSLTKLDLSNFDMSNDPDVGGIILDCEQLGYIKSPTMLWEDQIIELPTQFRPYSDITALTTANLAEHKVIILQGDKFIYEWKNLRTEGGDNGICNAIPSTSTGNAKLTQLLADYDNFDTETKEYVDKAIDKDNVKIGESVAYVKNVLAGTQTTENDYGINKEDAGSYMTMSITGESPYLIVVISLLGVFAVLGYYFYNKKKQGDF